MGRLIIAWLLAAVASATNARAEPPPQRFTFGQTEMATQIQIVLYATDNATAAQAAQAAFARFHQLNDLLSDYDPQSELRRLCDTAGTGKRVAVSDDLWRVLDRAAQLSKRSDGAFDVTVGPVVRLWRSARRTKELPPAASLQKALSLVGYQNVRLLQPQQEVELLLPRMRLDLGGIAKGYAVDQAMAALRQHGISRMMIVAGGNIGLGQSPPGKPGWRIGVAPPRVNSPPGFYLWLSETAISTSGDMWQYAIIGGTRYSHLIDPHTGMALTNQTSVTVVGPDGLSTDGLSSAVAVLGPKKGIDLIEATPGAAAFIVRMVAGKEETYASNRWNVLPTATETR